jgi:UDP-glucose 4-epimerase
MARDARDPGLSVTLVTGGLGYIGRRVVALLAGRGTQVVSFNRSHCGDSVPRVTFVQGDLVDIPRLVTTIEQLGVDQVIHTAAMSHPDISLEIPLTTLAANINGSAHLLEAMRLTQARRLVNLSSECAYGNRPEPVVTEDCPLEPTTPYGMTKAAVEMLGAVYNARYGFDVTSLRITEVYGPGNRMPQVLCDLIDAAVESRPYRLERGGEHPFQFIHVEDAARAAVLASEGSNLPRPAYNITGGVQMTIREAAETIKGLIPAATFDIGPGYLDSDRQGEYDISAAQRDIGYSPEWTLEQGILDYAAWRNETPSLVGAAP